ncbi:hypothetical protein ACFFGR_16770 [Arthrobacter liuii]|uniref:DUF2076 domain-containing protein n=1 Tax=Arthrobacter liuii TaxID=1476996 RepID=A0ABQ2AX82_9MICC|nr:hypothetical protein [Arthrobacter liuii]GGI00938.1 hypothetical protein GCM10007170_39240 [Arthrobacter liuii]
MPFIQSLKQRITAAMDVFTGSRDPQQRARQAAAVLPQAMSTAQARIEGTRNYLGSLPVPVGPGAHQGIAEAEGNLRSAVSLQSSDPVNALAYARMAAEQATRAGQMAQAEAQAGVHGYNGAGPWGRAGSGNGGGFARGLGAGVLGGIAGNMLFGGLFEDRDRDEGRGFEAMGDDDYFGNDGGGFGGGDVSGFGGGDEGSF